MRLAWIATGEQDRYTFECAVCGLDLELSDFFRDASAASVKSTH
jgi:hypothetical protein